MMSNERWRLDRRILLECDDTGEPGVIFDSHRADFCTCNSSAWLLVQQLKTGATLQDLTVLLRDRFSIREDQASRDTKALVGHLQSMGYVNVEE